MFFKSPETLLFHLEESLTDLRGLIPLLRITGGADKQTKIRFFEGKESVQMDTVRKILRVLNIRMLFASPLLDAMRTQEETDALR